MNDNKSAVITWISSGMNYSDGVVLLTRLSGKQNYAGIFGGKEHSLRDKLAYEICKAAKVADHITWKQFIQSSKAGKEDKSSLRIETTVNSEAPWSDLNPLGEYPPIIHRILHESASLFQQRSRLHRQMVDMPESNAAQLVSKRAELFDQVKSLSERLRVLYETKKIFLEKGIVPDEQQLYPEEKSSGSKVEIQDETVLKKQKKNLQTSNSKDLSLLDDSSAKPMPPSPRRMLLESRIKERSKRIEKIDYQLLNLRTK